MKLCVQAYIAGLHSQAGLEVGPASENISQCSLASTFLSVSDYGLLLMAFTMICSCTKLASHIYVHTIQ